ncbi:large conductance mechanosensitive channel protein MscL [soil metagenome]|jgi:large conductance mechanosensitive channel|nr:large conductance mechanosensitive channel protein MscL [Acidobacteriota bacterium]
MYKDFKAFISRGNVIDLAIAVVIGAAFTKIINTIADGLISPLISLVSGGALDFKDKYVNLSGQDVTGLAAKEIAEKGLAVFRYGELITDIINFLIVALIVFLIARWVGSHFKMLEAAAPPTKSEELLTEIRDLLLTERSVPPVR